ncbi:MAG: sugar phosphate isomerase/epimerase family protein [Sedimentisphaerales bacterium]|nr:sugar phosphate isomerase/epimerase family protein [Sedimentisphaerales bacterium]HNY77942.1 sugar phosphate isomerase/epimerase family protein [Sedimentisphaerales bacterium]HOC63338.1 sugar phosphate isomerase/epimerase family protein [Sedimentisphaerales bacterium]HOH64132.1 sugar phosphate isomerase/epimerase family protein [Sedimentisphaerales bacterium]HQA91458.1 sugar phosphate isomerase/epimerase family protein [Sedimentisphaerales bacterium]
MRCRNWPVGVCSWSLQTDIPGVAKAMKKLGLQHVHLAIAGAIGAGGKQCLDAIKAQDWTITSTMLNFVHEDYSTLDTIKVTGGIVPDEYWQGDSDLFAQAAEITAELGVKYLSMHAGFIDETDKAHAAKITDRIRTLADMAEENGVIFLLETGQESAKELRHFLERLDHNSVGVNFDPANMILYDKGNPIKAVHTLAPWIRHIHIKDALRTSEPGTWGAEVPWGDGQVGIAEFLAALEEVGYDGALAIEREAGDDRFGDIQKAVQRLAAAS